MLLYGVWHSANRYQDSSRFREVCEDSKLDRSSDVPKAIRGGAGRNRTPYDIENKGNPLESTVPSDQNLNIRGAVSQISTKKRTLQTITARNCWLKHERLRVKGYQRPVPSTMRPKCRHGMLPEWCAVCLEAGPLAGRRPARHKSKEKKKPHRHESHGPWQVQGGLPSLGRRR
jgi:hypothetical protein